MNKKKKIPVEIKPFFYGLTQLLAILENQKFQYKIKIHTVYDDNDDDQNVIWHVDEYAKHLICLNGETMAEYTKLVSSVTTNQIINKVDNLKCNPNYGNFYNIVDSISPLIKKYPYLLNIMDNIMDICYKNNGNITITQILLLARDYLNNNNEITLEERTKKLNKIITYMAN